MSQDLLDAEVVPVHRATFWVAAAGFLALAVGADGMGFFPAYDRLDFALQALGPVLLAIALLTDWRTHVERRGRAALFFFLFGILTYGALWIPYVINPESLGTASATHLGLIMSGIASISASIGTFVVLKRKESHLEHPIYSVEPSIKATFMQLLLFGLGTLLYGVNLIWVGEEDSDYSQFSLPAISLVLIAIAVISFESHLSVQVGKPAVVITILAISVYALNYVVHSFPQFGNEDWRPLAAVHSFCYAMGAVACALTAVYKAKAFKAGVSSR